MDAYEAFAGAFDTTTAKSSPNGKIRWFRRKISRNQRFIRLRKTAVGETVRRMVQPKRLLCFPFGRTFRVNHSPLKLLPSLSNLR